VPSPIPKPAAGLRAPALGGTPERAKRSLVGGIKLRLWLERDTTKTQSNFRQLLAVSVKKESPNFFVEVAPAIGLKIETLD